MKIIYQNEFCSIINYICTCTDCILSQFEYQDTLSICFLRKGNFVFHIFRDELDTYTGKILINKPEYEYRVAHEHTVPDECTIVRFQESAYSYLTSFYKNSLNGFFHKPDLQSILIPSTVEIDYLHNRIFTLTTSGNNTNMEIDCLLVEFIDRIFHLSLTDETGKRLSIRHKENYLSKVERAKDYILAHFSENITLSDIASVSCMSTFHFVRIFHYITQLTPYQYLLDARLKHAEQLLKKTHTAITDIGYLSGFNTPDHFSTAFRAKYSMAPLFFRQRKREQ
ncbi:AraC family transcriptional regulator [Xanthocytophaga agilis]|uniref:AraC family transcriptional regulator n=1 Tax=Xanthocytophaga agilis TaxID=3048010 RepID=A0AAE3R4K7_9BACT|nr:AraC family transcriptional regulator [Xanthocytophaga agilis]MDJ1501280.1 AraC family transcriptional regulator [Xanthocytophaga agilis]